MARPTNHDARISSIVKRLTAALSARARQQTESLIAAQVAAIIAGSGPAKPEETQVRAPAPKKKRGRRRAGKKIGNALAATWAKLTPTEREARIAKMHAWRKK